MDAGSFTNRELAGLIILVGFAVFVLAQPGRSEILKSAGAVLATCMKPMILIPFLLYIGWITLAASGAGEIALWNSGLMKVTILWLLFSGLALLFSLTDAISDPGFFRRAFFRVLGVVVIIEFFATLKSFPLWVEIPVRLLALPLAVVPMLAERDKKHEPSATFGAWYLGILGMSAVIWSITNLVSDWSVIDRGQLLREFLLPIWMTPIALLFVYGFSVFAAYDSTFKMMRLGNDDRPLGRQRLAIAVRANGRLGTLRLMSGLQASRIARAQTFRGTWQEIGNLRAEKRDKLANEAAAKRRLIDNAGVSGVDDEGRQLDQREFSETQAALLWLATCHMGHYRNGDPRYRTDLLSLVESGFERYGFPEDNNIETHSGKDDQRWYATRQTVTGWWFAIGAAGPPPDQWWYDGSAPPQGFPEDTKWDRFGGGASSINWS